MTDIPSRLVDDLAATLFPHFEISIARSIIIYHLSTLSCEASDVYEALQALQAQKDSPRVTSHVIELAIQGVVTRHKITFYRGESTPRSQVSTVVKFNDQPINNK